MQASNGYVTPVVLDMIATIRDWVHKLPEKPVIPGSGTTLWPIESLTRAAKERFNLDGWDVKDGFFMSRSESHSWLQKKLPNGTCLILDLNPPMSWGGPILFWHHHGPISYIYLDYEQQVSDDRRAVYERDAKTILDFPYSG